MTLMMLFSDNEQEKYKALYQSDATLLGFDYYQTDNIYQFLMYAREAKPEIVIMHFSPDFNNDTSLLEQIRENVCAQGTCPQIYLNKGKDFANPEFFCDVDFEKFNLRTKSEHCKRN